MINGIMTTKEAAAIWGLSQQTIKQLCIGAQGRPPRLTEKECNKSGGTWLVTYEGMKRLYGEPKNRAE